MRRRPMLEKPLGGDHLEFNVCVDHYYMTMKAHRGNDDVELFFVGDPDLSISGDAMKKLTAKLDRLTVAAKAFFNNIDAVMAEGGAE